MSEDKKNKPLQAHAAATDNTNNHTKDDPGKQDSRPEIYGGIYFDEYFKKHQKNQPFTEELAKALVMPQEYNFLNGMIVREYVTANDEIKRFPVAARPVYISKIIENLNDGNVFYELTFKARDGWKAETTDAETMKTRRKIVNLINAGLKITSETAKECILYLEKFEMMNERALPFEYGSEQLGYLKHGFLLGNEFITTEQEKTPVSLIPLNAGERQYSEYYKQRGTMQEWKENIFDKIKPYPKAVIYTLLSFGSVLMHKLKLEKPFIVEISNASSIGKSTTMKVAASVWGNHDGLIMLWNTTNVNIEQKMKFTKNLPVFLDDTKTIDDVKRISKLIYAMAAGVEKGRGHIKGTRAAARWINILFSTGEKKITEFSNDEGTSARSLTMHGDIYGDNKELVDHLNEVTNNYYGTAGHEFIEKVLEQDAKEWEVYRTLFKEHWKKSAEAAGDNKILQRQAAAFALAIVTAEILNKWFSFDINIDHLYEEWENEIVNDNTGDADRPKQALFALYDYTRRKQNQFYYTLCSHTLFTEALGEWEYRRKNWDEIRIVPSVVDEFLDKNGYDRNTILKQWRERGYIDTEKNKFTKRCRTLLGDGNIKGDFKPFIVLKRKFLEENED